MINSTIGDLLDGKLDAGACRLYVVRDGETVFYVGQGKDVVARLLAHVGQGIWGFRGLSQLGEAIKLNWPESRHWQIELHTVKGHWRGDINAAEKELIRRCRPHLNYTHNEGAKGSCPTATKTLVW